MDSSGIGILLNRYKQMQRSGGQCGHLWRGGPDQPDTESGWHLEPDQWIFIKRSGDCRNGGVRKMEDKKEEKNENIQAAGDHFALEIDSDSRNEEFARVVTAVFLSRLNPTLEELDDVKTAVQRQ